jgi:alanine dehydrogenase
VRVYSRSFAHAASFAGRESQRHSIEIEPIKTAQAAVEGADIICTTTSSQEPVVRGDWIAAGAHINAVGASRPAMRELDSAAVVKARLYVDRRESTLNEAGDFLIPRSAGLIGDDHIAGELGELLLGRVPGRTAPEQITLFKSLGIAIEDLAAAHYIWQKAQQEGKGTWLEIGGRHFGSD